MSQAGVGRKQSLKVPCGLEADVAKSCNWKTVVRVPCASRVDFLYPFCRWAHCGSSSVLFLPHPVLVSRGMCWDFIP